MLQNKKLEETLLLLPYYYMLTGVFFLEHPDKKAVVFFIISIVASLYTHGFKYSIENIKKPIVILLITATAYSIFGYYFYNDGSKEIRVLFCLSLYFIVIPHDKFKIEKLSKILIVGAIISLINMFYYTYLLGFERESGFINANVYAGLTGTFAIISLSMSLTRVKFRLVNSVSFLLYTYSTILTQSRTAMASIVICSLLIVFIKYIGQSKVRINKKKAIAFIIGMLLIVGFSKEKIENRINITLHEISQLKNEDLNSSMGLRIQMWEFAPSIIKKHPIIGAGGKHKKYIELAYEKGEISADLYEFNPPGYHNEIINRLVKGGIIGLIILSLFYFIPIKASLAQPIESKILLLGIISFYAIFGLTMSPLTQGVTILLYGLFVIPFCSLHSKPVELQLSKQ